MLLKKSKNGTKVIHFRNMDEVKYEIKYFNC